LPILSEFLIKKIKTSLRNKAVYPELIEFELMHPRAWWPEGTRHLYPKTDVAPDDIKEKEEIEVKFSTFSDISSHISNSIHSRTRLNSNLSLKNNSSYSQDF
jgi:hypothetical protein